MKNLINVHVKLLLNRDITCFHKTREIFVVGQHGDNLIRGDLAFPFHNMDVKVGVPEGGMPIGKEIGKRRPVNLGDLLAYLEAKDEREMLERGKIP